MSEADVISLSIKRGGFHFLQRSVADGEPEYDPYMGIRGDLSSLQLTGFRQSLRSSARPQADGKAAQAALQEELARASAQIAAEMNSTFLCSRGVQGALAAIGLKKFLGCGDAWDMGMAMRRSGLFKLIPESEAQRGDIGVQAWSQITVQKYFDQYHGRNLGDIFVVQSNKRGHIWQSNDHEQLFEPRDQAYDASQRYFLRIISEKV